MSLGVLSKIGIDCILSEGTQGLQGEGCIYNLSSSHFVTLSPDHLQPGDYVKLRLWLPDDGPCIVIELAEVQCIQDHRIELDPLVTSPKDQARLKQFITAQGCSSHRLSETIMIRA